MRMGLKPGADIKSLKQILPLDALLRKLGHGELVKQKAHCPFHDDANASFSVWHGPTNELLWKCFAGCSNGYAADVIGFVHRFFELPNQKAAIKRYAELAGDSPSAAWEAVRLFKGNVVPNFPVTKGESSGAVAGAAPKPSAPTKLEPLTLKAATQIAKWRGLTVTFLMKMSDRGIIGLYDSKPAFTNGEGSVQYRIPNDGWRYAPSGSRANLLLITSEGKDVYIAESCWDALAIHEATKAPVLCTRGASTAKLAIDYVKKSEAANFIAIPQNDAAGAKWLEDLREEITVKVKRVPKQFKDFNELVRAQNDRSKKAQ